MAMLTEEAAQQLQESRASVTIAFGGASAVLDSCGAAYLEDHGALIVSDLHLEKGSGAAARGRLVPALDSHDTLQRLARVVHAYRPRRVICLGDSFHDMRAGERMADADRAALASICASAPEWIWISGNHDPETPEFCEGKRLHETVIDGIAFRHQPDAGDDRPQIVGHFHPKASIPAGARRFSGPCFCVSDDLLIMPAFGAYAGGLSCANPAIRSLYRSDPRIYMLHAAKIWRVG